MRKLLCTAVALGVLSSTTLMPIAYADVSANALPSLNSAINADVTTSGSNMNVQIQGGQGGLGTLNWNNYNIGKDATVNYEFTAHSQTALNKVAATGGLSQIYGKITSSGCSGCGYDATGKVILINPNGVLFGDGANVNLNSFTVSTMDGSYDKANNQLILNKGANQKDFGIVVQEGARIHGDKNVTFASNNISLYNGSKISTSVAPNVGDTAYGKVKLVTSDGVNFTYYNNGAVKSLSNIAQSANKMMLSINGDIQSGNIDARNMSTNTASEINLKGATLKATKAEKGNDGNIWLTASNKVVSEDSTFETVNYSANAASRDAGNVKILANKKVSVGTGSIKAVGNVDITSQEYDVVVDKTNIDTPKNVTLNAARIASIQNGSTVKGNNVTVNGITRAQVNNSRVEAKQDVNLTSDQLAWTDKATLIANKDVNVKATNGDLLLTNSAMTAQENVNLVSKNTISSEKLAGLKANSGKDITLNSTAESVILTGRSNLLTLGKLNLTAAKNVEINSKADLTAANTNIKAGENVFLTSAEGSVNVKDTTKFVSAKKIYIQGAKDVKTTNTVDLNNIQTNIDAGNNVNVILSNVGNRQNGLVAKAGNDMVVTTNGTLSVSSLISGNDMTIQANKVIAGLPYTTVSKLPEDPTTPRSYIEVGGKFVSNVTNDNYEVTASGELTNDGKFNKKHHIQYGKDEKILLINKRPVENKVTDPTLPGLDNGDDVDVINPGQTPDSPEPSNPGDGGDQGGDVNPNPGDGGDQGGDVDPNPGDGGDQGGDGEQEPCPDTPNDDVVEEEETPGLLSAQDLLKYALQSKNQKKI